MDLFFSLQIDGVKALIEQRAGGRVGSGVGKGFQLTSGGESSPSVFCTEGEMDGDSDC